LGGKNKIELFFYIITITMPSLIKRSNLKWMSNNIDILYNNIVQLIRLINIPIKIIKFIPLTNDKKINTNKFLYYHLIYKTLQTIYSKLPLYLKISQKNNKRIIRFDIYIDHKYLHSGTKIITE
jgi:hypothetical protein